MTCVIGLVEDNKIYVGADNVESTEISLLYRKDLKVFTKKDVCQKTDFIFGCSSSFRMIQLLQYHFEIPETSSFEWENNSNEEISVDSYMCTIFIESLRELFKNKGFSTTNNNEETGGSFIVGVKKYLYEIQPDYQVSKPKDNFCCIGTGYLSAYGAMTALHNNNGLTPVSKIEESLKIAEYYNPYVRGPFVIKSIG